MGVHAASLFWPICYKAAHTTAAPAVAMPAPSGGPSATVAIRDEEWAATKIQTLERGRQARKRMNVCQVTRQVKMLKSAATKFNRLKPLDGKVFGGGFPGAPVNASIQLALHEDERTRKASCYERARDSVLRWFVRHTRLFMRIAVVLIIVFVIDILVIIVFFWGAVMGVGIMDPNVRAVTAALTRITTWARANLFRATKSFSAPGRLISAPDPLGSPSSTDPPPCVAQSDCVVNMSEPHSSGYGPRYTVDLTTQYPPIECTVYTPDGNCHSTRYVADYCNLNQYVFNICIKVIVILLTYINVLPIPWRVAIMVDAWGDACRTEVEPPGVDFYGRPTEAVWFHIPRYDRARISFFLNSAYFWHIINLTFVLVYWPYIETQIWPGAFLINVPAFLSIGSVITAAVLQGKAEDRVIAANPERFPPPAAKYVKEAVAEWWKGKSGKSLWVLVKEHLDERKMDCEGKGVDANALLEIAMDDYKQPPAGAKAGKKGAAVNGKTGTAVNKGLASSVSATTQSADSSQV